MSLPTQIMPAQYVLPFIKMQALGNDFIVVDGQQLLESAARPLVSQWLELAPLLAKQLCQRRFSIGADGLILAMSLAAPEMKQLAKQLYGDLAEQCQLSWTYHNSDGSVSQMCGNGLRCLGRWAKNEKSLGKTFQIATGLGIVPVDCQAEGDITVRLAPPKLSNKEIPYTGPISKEGNVIKQLFDLENWQFPITCINVGNPHCVIFEAGFFKPDTYQTFNQGSQENFFPQELVPIARAIEVDKRFPERTNVEFAHVIDRRHVQVYVWERGCGPTLACGSGAVATAVAGILEGRLDKKVLVSLPGGDLFIDWSEENTIQMTGSASTSFYGEIKMSVQELTAPLKILSQVKVAKL